MRRALCNYDACGRTVFMLTKAIAEFGKKTMPELGKNHSRLTCASGWPA